MSIERKAKVAVLIGLMGGSAVFGQAQEVVGDGVGVPVPPGGGSSAVWGAPAAVLYDNGPLTTHPGAGCAAGDASRLQDSSLGMTTLGFGHQALNDNRVADDFTVPDGGDWELTTVTFFAYQTGSTTTSTITAVNAQILDGPPGGAANVVCGDTVTNCQTATAFSGIYRDTETTVAACNRPIMAQSCDFSGCVLPPGTYWIDWQTDGTLASGPWAPPVTITGTAVTGNALQGLAGVWAPALDTGTGTPQQAFPFVIEGVVGAEESILAIPTLGTIGLALLALGLGAAAAFRIRRRPQH